MTKNYLSVIELFRDIRLQLIPFLITSILYFVFMSFGFFDSMALQMFMKMSSTICLIGFMLARGIKFTKQYRYHQLMLIAFIISCPADAWLEEEHSFIYGVVGYAIVHAIFIKAFGWKPLKPKIGLVTLVLTVSALSLMYKGFTGIWIFVTPTYCTFLGTMAWRSMARIENFKNIPKLFGAVGGLSLVISDTILGLDRYRTPNPYAKTQLMFLYFISYLGYALSTLDIDLLNENEKAK